MEKEKEPKIEPISEEEMVKVFDETERELKNLQEKCSKREEEIEITDEEKKKGGASYRAKLDELQKIWNEKRSVGQSILEKSFSKFPGRVSDDYRLLSLEKARAYSGDEGRVYDTVLIISPDERSLQLFKARREWEHSIEEPRFLRFNNAEQTKDVLEDEIRNREHKIYNLKSSIIHCELILKRFKQAK